jgi:hypothetical protein
MVTTMHETMIRRLQALEVLHKGGQRAVDAFMSGTLTGMEKQKAEAIKKVKRGNDGGNSRKRSRSGGNGGVGGAGGGDGTALAPGGGSLSGGGGGGGYQGGRNFQGNQNFNARPPGIKCDKCNCFGHKTEDCGKGA